MWHSAATSIATISSTGLIKAKKTGTVTVGARPSSNKKWAKAVVKVTDSLMPASITLNVSSLSLAVGGTAPLTATALPSSAAQTFKWASNKSSVASVSSTGLVTARKEGTALIRATSTRSSGKYRTIKVTVSKLAAPSKLTITPATTTVEKGETLQLTTAVTPTGADASVKWTTSSSSVATISSSGLVTAKKVGTVQIKAAASAKSSVYTIRTLRVVDTKTVTSVDIEADSSVVRVGGTLTLSAEISPSTAEADVDWASNNTSVASVSSSGTVTGKSVGSATITAKAGGKTDTLRVVVQKNAPVTVEPSQKTSVAGISANLAKIDDILRYAVTELDALNDAGEIDKNETLARKTILLNAFQMARFPWKSDKTITYYTGSGSYDSNVVYFGIPYTQKNRTFNVDRLLSAGAFAKESGNSYYTANLIGVTYPGNDCSSFVSMSQWGVGSSYSALNSNAMKTSTAYKTIASASNMAGYLKMRPGDVLVKNGHALMFLYYANSAKSSVMVIQQGGYTTLSTTGCDVKALSYYSGNASYVARRKTSFD